MIPPRFIIAMVNVMAAGLGPDSPPTKSCFCKDCLGLARAIAKGCRPWPPPEPTEKEMAEWLGLPG